MCLAPSGMQAVKDFEARLLLEELAAVVSAADKQPVTAEDARQWTLHQWVADLFPVRRPADPSFCLSMPALV